jgi:hypothetical protein
MIKLVELFVERFFSEKSTMLRNMMFAIYLFCIFTIGGLLEKWTFDTFMYILFPLILFGGVLINGVFYLQDIYELNAFEKVLNHLTSAIFGGGLPSLRIVNGEKEIKAGEINVVDRIGGPGTLKIEQGNVAVLETLKAPSRILGAGDHPINRGEMIKSVIMLGEYSGKIEEFIVATRDGIDVKVSGVEYRFCINSSNPESRLRTLQNPYPFSRKAVYDLVYNRNVGADGTIGDWTDSVKGAIKGVISGHIASHELDALLSPPAKGDHPVYQLHKKFDDPKYMDKIKSAGARLVWINIGNVSPAQHDIEEQRLKVWLARQSGTERLLKAQGEAEKISSRERGRAESQSVLLRSIAQALREVDSGDENDKSKTAKNLWNIVLARTAQILESMTEAHHNRAENKADREEKGKKS